MFKLRLAAYLEVFLGFLLSKIAYLPISPRWLQERLVFEEEHSSHQASESFNQKSLKADACFQFSSEGEFEQIAVLVDDLIQKGKKVELIYTSKSVLNSMQNLYRQYPQSVRMIPYCFLKQVDFKKWMSAKKVYLVRYDFFPRFVVHFQHCTHRVLISASFKKQRLLKKRIPFWNRLVLPFFDQIVFATPDDLLFYKKEIDTGQDLRVGDFRTLQIIKRLSKKEQTLCQALPFYKSYCRWVNGSNLTLVIGSAWQEDLNQLKDQLIQFLKCNGRVVIIPHQLDEMKIKAMQAVFSKENIPCEVLDAKSSWNELGANIVILKVKGILCELYADFKFALVGGGWSSVHSVMEPFMAGCCVFCGPRVERSSETEFLLSYDQNSVNILEQKHEFLEKIFSQPARKDITLETLSEIESHGLELKKVILCEKN